MNLTEREQEILDSISSWNNMTVVPAKLAQFLAHMEGSKEDVLGEDWTGKIRAVDPSIPTRTFAPTPEGLKDVTPPSEEKKCCNNIGGKNTHWQDCPSYSSPTPPDPQEEINEALDRIYAPDAWEGSESGVVVDMAKGFIKQAYEKGRATTLDELEVAVKELKCSERDERGKLYTNQGNIGSYNQALTDLLTRLKKMRTK